MYDLFFFPVLYISVTRMQSMNSPVSSSEDVDYDECVVVVEENADVFSLPDADKSSIAVLKPNKGSGRVSKKSK